MAESLRSRIHSRVTSLSGTLHSSALARAALTTGMLTILCKVIGFTKELVIASQFGMGATLDSYLVSIVLPNLVVNVFAIGFARSLVMQYVQDQTNSGENVARERFSG